MANPWLKKNVYMSLWLSGANRIASTARGQISAAAKRQATTATKNAAQDILSIWAGALAAPARAPARKKKR